MKGGEGIMDKEKNVLEVKIPDPHRQGREEKRKQWKKPTLEDVSGKVMAQPYIRFT